MAGWNDRSRGASPQPPGRAAYSREWRAGLAPRRRRTPKRVLIGAFGLLLAAVVGLVAYFLLLPVAGSVPPARLVLVGIGAYQDRAFPPNAFARGDVAALHALQDTNPKQFPDEKPWDDMLTGRTLLDQMGHKLQQMEHENLVVFCSLHALVQPGDPGHAELYAIHADPDSPHSEQTDQMIPLPDLLAALGRTSAERIVLLLDVGRLLPNWRLGVLAGDVPAQLEQDVARAAIPRLTVLCSAGSHERSWGAPEWKQSVFGYYVVEGLNGAADGWSEPGAQKNTPDQRVSMNELYGYVHDSVAAWAREHRGVPQTVLRFGSAEDFPLVAIRDQTPANPGAEPGAADANSGKKAAAQAETSEKGEKTKAGDQRVAKGKEKAKAAEEKPVDPWDELFKLWTQRDLLWREGRTAGSAPHLWRRLQAHLLAAEQQLRAGADEEARATVAQAAGMLQELRRGDVPADLRTDSGRFALSAGSLLGAGRLDRETEQKIAQYAQPIIAAGQSPQPPPATGAAPAPPTGSAPAAVPQAPPAPELVARWLMAEASEQARPERLVQLGFVLKTIEPEQWPVELASLARLVARAQTKPSFWSEDLVSQFFELRARSPSGAVLDPVVFPLVRDELGKGLRALDAAERWLVADGGANGQAETWLRKAENSFSLADRIAQQAAAHVRLRDELLVSLPDLARWVALRADDAPDRTVEWDAVREGVRRLRRRAELGGELDAAFIQDVLGVWPATSGEQDQRERLLLELMLRTHLLQSALWASEDMPADDMLTRLSQAASDAERLWQLLQQDVAAEMNAVIRRGQITAEDWRTADRLLLNPWIDVEHRRQLLDVISREPRGGFFKPAANRRDERGLWQGFWAIQTLALGGADDDQLARLWEQWDDLLAAVTAPGDGDPLAVRQRRAQLGLSINRQWWMLAERASRPTQGDRKWNLLVRGLDPWDQPSSDPDDVLRQQRTAQFQQYLAVQLEDIQRRQDQHAAYAGQLQSGQRLLARIGPASPPAGTTIARPRLARVEAPPFRSDRTAQLSVAVEAPPADAAQMQVLLEADRVRVSRDGTAVEPGRPVALSSADSAFDLRLDANAVGPQRMLVALLGPDGFPFDVRSDIVLQPPFDPNSWRIEFQTAQEGRPVRQDHLTGSSKLYLPPSGTVSLKAVLVRPSTDTTQAVDVVVSRRRANGAVDGLIPKTTIQLPPDKTRAELTLSLGGAAASPPANAASPAGAAEPPQAEPVDISEGLVFELTPQGRETFAYTVQPVFWSAEAFVEPPRPRFEKDTLSVPVVRRDPQANGNEDLLLPPQIAVSLSIPDSLLQPSQTRVLGSDEPSLGFGQRRELSVTFNRALLADEYEEIKLSVAGLPHAFRWQVRPDQPAVLLPGRPPQVRIASPVQGQVLKQEKDPLVIRLEVDASELDLTGGENETWRLSYEILRDDDGRRANAGRSDSWELRSSLDRRIGLAGPQEGVWKITTAAGDHKRELTTAGLSGRFLLLARLYRGENVAAEHQVGFAIDDEAPPLVRIDAGDERIFRRDRALTVRVATEDRQSGITSVVVGIDANRNEKIDDEERVFEKQFLPIERPAFEDRITIPPRLLPAMAGTYDVLAGATNGVGTAGSAKLRVALQDPPKPPPTPQPTTGSILVKFSNARGKKTVTLAGPTRRTETAESGQATVRFSDLQPGAYEIDVRGYMRNGSAKNIQVRAGETTQVDIAVQ